MRKILTLTSYKIMITSLLSSKSSLVCTIGRELNERGLLASILYAVFAIGLPYLAAKLRGVFKRNEQKNADKSVCCRQMNAGAAVTILACLVVVFMPSVVTVPVLMLVYSGAVLRYRQLKTEYSAPHRHVCWLYRKRLCTTAEIEIKA